MVQIPSGGIGGARKWLRRLIGKTGLFTKRHGRILYNRVGTGSIPS